MSEYRFVAANENKPSAHQRQEAIVSDLTARLARAQKTLAEITEAFKKEFNPERKERLEESKIIAEAEVADLISRLAETRHAIASANRPQKRAA